MISIKVHEYPLKGKNPAIHFHVEPTPEGKNLFPVEQTRFPKSRMESFVKHFMCIIILFIPKFRRNNQFQKD